MDENEQPPRGEKRKIVKLENREVPALHIMNAIEHDYKEARRQIEEITLEMVIEKLNELMLSLGKKCDTLQLISMEQDYYKENKNYESQLIKIIKWRRGKENVASRIKLLKKSRHSRFRISS